MIITSQTKIDKRYCTPEEYLIFERDSTEKYEYYDGELILMTGGTTNHNTLAINFMFCFLSVFREQNYQIYMGDVKLWIEKNRYYTYPDVMIVKGEPIYHGEGKTMIINPCLIVEVLSNSTKDYDQNDKFDSYRTLADFQEYILIDQYQYYVKQFTKNEQEKWVLTDYYGEESELKLESINFTITLKELYKRVNFQEIDED